MFCLFFLGLVVGMTSPSLALNTMQRTLSAQQNLFKTVSQGTRMPMRACAPLLAQTAWPQRGVQAWRQVLDVPAIMETP